MAAGHPAVRHTEPVGHEVGHRLLHAPPRIAFGVSKGQNVAWAASAGVKASQRGIDVNVAPPWETSALFLTFVKEANDRPNVWRFVPI